MTITECAADCGRVEMTIRRWINAGKLPVKRHGLRDIFIEPAEWEKFCAENNIKRRIEEK
jgi:hypothetical protein